MLQRPGMHFTADKSVCQWACHHASLFRQQIVHIPEMHENDCENDRIRRFHSGLTPQLRTECIVNMNGNEFTWIPLEVPLSCIVMSESGFGHDDAGPIHSARPD